MIWYVLWYLVVGAFIQKGVEASRVRNKRPVMERRVSMIVWLLWPMVFIAGVYIVVRKV